MALINSRTIHEDQHSKGLAYYNVLYANIYIHLYNRCVQGGEGDQQQVEEAAEQEISEIVRHKELLEQRKAEMEARQQLLEKEREDMGVMWGMGKCMTDR